MPAEGVSDSISQRKLFLRFRRHRDRPRFHCEGSQLAPFDGSRMPLPDDTSTVSPPRLEIQSHDRTMGVPERTVESMSATDLYETHSMRWRPPAFRRPILQVRKRGSFASVWAD